MKTQEASRCKTRLLPEKPSVVAYTFPPSLLTKCMSFHYSLMLQLSLRPLHWCILNGEISPGLLCSTLRILASQRQCLQSRNEISLFRSLREKNMYAFLSYIGRALSFLFCGNFSGFFILCLPFRSAISSKLFTLV